MCVGAIHCDDGMCVGHCVFSEQLLADCLGVAILKVNSVYENVCGHCVFSQQVRVDNLVLAMFNFNSVYESDGGASGF